MAQVEVRLAESIPCSVAGCQNRSTTEGLLVIGDIPIELSLCIDHGERLRFLAYALNIFPPQPRGLIAKVRQWARSLGR